MRLLLLLALLFAAACGTSSRPPIEIRVPAELRQPIEEFAALLPWEPVRVVETELAKGDGLRVEIVRDLTCRECYRLERVGETFVVHAAAGDVLGAQYGLAALLEAAGFRFFHPFRSRAPERLAIPADAPGFGVELAPEVARRGLHLHTLHPIEAYYAFWSPSAAHLADARRVVDWIVKNRGNYVQWVALDDIVREPAALAPWREHTRAIVDAAHARGVGVGAGVQLFGASNLQQGFDLVDSEPATADVRAEAEARFPILLDGIAWDVIHLSFGEFFGADPSVFVAGVDAAYAVLQEQAPGTEMVASIHVGDTPDLRVEYMGESILYYFLVKYANPAIVPWVHTVMYYNLFEDAGGAYHHEDFGEHRAFMEERLAAGEPVGYYPESAYWIAFDNSVPTYLPLYVRSRWLDLAMLPALEDHVVFTTGWEWGYWQGDYASLRAGFRRPASWEELFVEMYAPWDGAVAQAIVALTEAEHEALIVRRLAPFLAGRDVYIDLGDEIGIVSQPDRPSFAEVAALPAAERAAFAGAVLVPFAELAAAAGDARAAFTGDDPWMAELADGAEVTAARARYVRALYAAVVAHADGGDPAPLLADADAALAAGRAAVQRRHAAMHHPEPLLLTGGDANATIYPFGYLKQADELCYWERERAQARELILGEDTPAAACIY